MSTCAYICIWHGCQCINDTTRYESCSGPHKFAEHKGIGVKVMATTPARTVKIGSAWTECQERARARGKTMTDAVEEAIQAWPRNSFRAEIYRDRQWWMIHVPEIDAITQASWEGEVWQVARALIAVTLDIDPATVNVELVILPGAKEE